MHQNFITLGLSFVTDTSGHHLVHLSKPCSPKSGVRQDANAVAHHTHLVQAGLPVEEHQVTVLQLALHLVSNLQITQSAMH
jgi:hypothetical protein